MIRPDEGRWPQTQSREAGRVRFAAVKAVQAGQSPSAVARAMGFTATVSSYGLRLLIG